MDGERDRYRTIAGLSLLGVGIVSVLGIVTAEALYPEYSTSRHTISALGGAAGPGVVVQPSATLFNGAMVVSGLLTLVAAYGLHRAAGRRALTAAVAVTGVGVAGVGIFPTQFGVLHSLAAMVAFGGGGLSAVVAATVVDGPLRYLSVALGVTALVALVGFVVLGGSTALGIGGLERWVSYPVQIWVLAFGGYLLGRGGDASDRSV